MGTSKVECLVPLTVSRGGGTPGWTRGVCFEGMIYRAQSEALADVSSQATLEEHILESAN